MPIIRSPSNCRCSLWFPYECGGWWFANRPRLRALPPPHSYGNQRLQRQFDGLLMMDIVMPETCWAVSVWQGNKFYDWLLHLVGCFIRVSLIDVSCVLCHTTPHVSCVLCHTTPHVTDYYQQFPPCMVRDSGVVFASVCWQKESLFVCSINSVYLHDKNKKINRCWV